MAQDALIDYLKRRKLHSVFLLFFLGHRPLAFVAGQLLYLLHPMASMLGFSHVQEWGDLLSQPDEVAALRRQLSEVGRDSP